MAADFVLSVDIALTTEMSAYVDNYEAREP